MDMERLGGYDPVTLCRWGTLFCLFTYNLGIDPSKYNLPLYLFGLVASELTTSGTGSNRLWITYIQILLSSLFLDFFSLLSSNPSTSLPSPFPFLLKLASAFLKFVLYRSALRVLRERGDDFEFGGWGWLRGRVGGVTGRGGGGGGGGGNNAQNGGANTIFQMPGAFSQPPTGQSQTTSQPNPNARFPGNGFTLGSAEDDGENPGQGQGQGQGYNTGSGPGRGGYQSLP